MVETLNAARRALPSAILVAAGWWAMATDAPAQKPPKLTNAQIERLTRNGDRLADQGDYLAALEKYTRAYLGVVSRIRGQDFLAPVAPNILSREELGEEMLQMMEDEYTAEELLLMDSSYKAFGLMAAEQRAETLIRKLLTEEVAGFYDPDKKRMVLILEKGSAKDPGWFGRLLGARPAFDKDEQKTTLAHELTHALQDQLYDLNSMEEHIEHDDDMLLAFAALVEGDATLLMFLESGDQELSDMDPEALRATFNMMSWMTPLAGGKSYREAPPIFRESLIFPYFQGMLFTLGVAGQGGWPAVHEAYSRPPLSTEQILHPEKYMDASQLDAPQSVTIPDLAEALGQSWSHLGGNCLGELQTSIMLKQTAGGTQAAEGWDGDWYEVFRNEDEQLALVQVSIWDSHQDAEEYATAYRHYRQTIQDKSKSFAADAQRFVEQHDDQVWIIEGLPKAQHDAIRAKLKDCKFEDKIFPVQKSPSEDSR